MTPSDESDFGIRQPPVKWIVHIAGLGIVHVTYAGLNDVDAVLRHLREHYPEARDAKFLAVWADGRGS
jgi:hypothetical protein